MKRSNLLELIWQLTKRDVIGRYKGSWLGIGWSFAYPLLMLCLYTFVFSGIFNARWPGVNTDSKLMFATNLFAGLVIINMLAEVASKASTLILSNVNYVKRVVFPLEILGIVTVLSATFHAAVSIVLLIFFKLIASGSLSWSILAIPILWLPLCIFCSGLGWAISALGVYIRDMALLVNVGISLLLFVSPIFFPSSAYPERWRGVLELNPLVWMIEEMRSIIIQGAWPKPLPLVVAMVSAIATTYFCYQFFKKARRGFADVL